MRSFQSLDYAVSDEDTGILSLQSSNNGRMQPRLSMRREGSYIVISASYGPLEMALRLRYEEFVRILSRLRPIDGLQTTRQVGTGQAYIAMGLHTEGQLMMRPTIVADATGHITFNLLLTDTVREALFKWLPVEV